MVKEDVQLVQLLSSPIAGSYEGTVVSSIEKTYLSEICTNDRRNAAFGICVSRVRIEAINRGMRS
jgi:hypothetical protein